MAILTVSDPQLNAKFDPRTGNTGDWLGSDCAVSIPFGSGKFLWIFNDTFWRTSGSGVPTDRLGAEFTNDSFAIQTGTDLRTATMTFHRSPDGGNFLKVPGGTHFSWCEGGIMIGTTLYLMSKRTLRADWTHDAGWCVHKIQNAATTAPADWNVEFLYQSDDTNCRPILCPFQAEDDSITPSTTTGFVYAYAIELTKNWHLARWSYADFIAGNFANVKYNNGFDWITDPTIASAMANVYTAADGSVHRRSTDSRMVMIDSNGFDNLAAPPTIPGFRVNTVCTARVAKDEGGVYYPGNNYFPTMPYFQPEDRAQRISDDNRSGTVLSVVDSTHVSWKRDDIWGGGTFTVALSDLFTMTGNGRIFYRPPENQRGDTSTYAAKAHPEIPGIGLAVTYLDNRPTDNEDGTPIPGALRYDLSCYWPKFVRILPPQIRNITYSSGNVNLTIDGDPDRLHYRLNGGSWTELTDPTTRVFALATPGAGTNVVEIKATGIGGQVTQKAVLNVGSLFKLTDGTLVKVITGGS